MNAVVRLFFLRAALAVTAALGTALAEPAPVHLAGPEIAKLDWGTRMMRVADFNGDGRRDLVFINADRASLDFLYQLGPGESKPVKPNIVSNRWEPIVEDARFRLHRFTTGASMLELAVGDFNHDGWMDLAYTSESDPLVVRYQESSDEWTEIKPPLLPAANNLVGSLIAADVNADGRTDLLMATRQEILVLRQTADGTLATADRYPLTEDGAESLQVHDFDRDGRPDLLYICRQNSLEPIRVRLQLASGHFGSELRIAAKDLGTSLEPVTAMPGMDAGETGHVFLTTDFREGRVERLTLRVEAAKNSERDWVAPRVLKLTQAGNSAAGYAFGGFAGDGLTAFEQQERSVFNFTPQFGRDASNLAATQFMDGELFVMTALLRFGGGGDDGVWQLVVLLQAIGQGDAIGAAVALVVEIPERGLGDAGDVAAHDDFDGQWLGVVGDGDVGVWHADDVVGQQVGRFLKPPGGKLI